MHLFLDGRNAIYRAVHAAIPDKLSVSKYPAVFFRFLVSDFSRFPVNHITIFWDDKRSNLWRSSIFDDYKASRDSDKEVLGDVNNTEITIRSILDLLPIRQAAVDGMEADDLIYAACHLIHPKEIIVISSDNDLNQLALYFDSVRVYDPIKKKVKDRPQHNVIIASALKGDKSDNIVGYKGVGKIRSHDMSVNNFALARYLDDNGGLLFGRNMALIDLSLCPYTLKNIQYLIAVFGRQVKSLDLTVLRKFIRDERIPGLTSELDRLEQFRNLT